MPLAGKPVLVHTLERFYASGLFESAAVVLPEAEVAGWPAFCTGHDIDRTFFDAVPGGATRFDSVGAGLSALNRRYSGDTDLWVAVHDGVRPLVSAEFLNRCLQAAFRYGNAVPALQPVESFRYLEPPATAPAALTPTADPTPPAPDADIPNRPVDRDRLRSLQTPQCARLSRLTEAWHQAAARPETEKNGRFTDEATVLEFAGDRIHLCEGSPFNLKITRPADLKWAEFVLQNGLTA